MEFFHLSIEVLFLISELLDQSSLLSLYLTSRQAREIAIYVLWKTLSQNHISSLHWSLVHRRLGLAETFVNKYKVNINTKYKGETPLICACRLGFVEGLEWLMKHKDLDVGSCDANGRNALWWAADNIRHTKSVELLIKHEDTNLNCQDTKNGTTPLILSIMYNSFEILELLLSDPRTDTNTVDHHGQSPLHHAVYRDNPQIIELLAQSTATNINSRDNERQTPLILADKWRSPRATRSLLSIPAVEAELVDIRGSTALCYAVEDGDNEIVQQLLERTSGVHNCRNEACNKTLFN